MAERRRIIARVGAHFGLVAVLAVGVPTLGDQPNRPGLPSLAGAPAPEAVSPSPLAPGGAPRSTLPPLAGQTSVAASIGSDPMASDLMRSDARLNDVCFVDPLHGWAVGDRGTIWHTDDGGQTWQLQPSAVSCRLESVSFIDTQNGWAAGGYSHPYSHTSTGVVLFTRDGGRHWTSDSRLLLPALRQIRFVNPRQGWAIGCGSALFPAGVFFSEDGARSWNPMPGERTFGWVTADFLAPSYGVLGDSAGLALAVRPGSERTSTTRFGLRSVTRMKLVPEVEPQVYGWLVGQGGLVMWTSDLGASWQMPPGPLPEAIAQEFDFAALAVRGPKVWVAGSPGTLVLHSPDAGHTWTAAPTGQSLPLRSLFFADDQHGWAVGELGTILSTSDGGQTWRRNRSGGTRAALLGFFGEPSDVPLELFARLSGDEGYLGVVETLTRPDAATAPRGGVPQADRLREALVGVGASGAGAAWRFPLPQEGPRLSAEQIVAGWDLANDGRGLEQMKVYVVRQIRLWRPEVIVTHQTSPTGDDPLGTLIHQVVVEAVRAAADPTAFSEQITRAGLGPWQVKKVYGAMPPGTPGEVNVAGSDLAERLGRSLADVVAMPRGLLEDRYRVPPPSLGFRLVLDTLQREPNRDDFFAGIVLYPGGDARRELFQPAGGTVEMIRRIAEKRRNMQAIIERTERDPQGGLGLLAQAEDITQGLDPDGSAQLLFRLAQRYYQSGQWPMAAEGFELLAERHPEHPLARAALVWLVQYYASGEAAWRVRGRQRLVVQQASAMAADPSLGESRVKPATGPVVVGAASAPAIDFTREEDRLERAAALGKQLERAFPALYAEPSIRFPLAAVDRQRGFPAQAERFYLVQSRSTTRDGWWACARGEQWLADPKGIPPKPVIQCVKAAARPYLDGRLDDPVWQRARPAALKSPHGDDAEWPAKVLLAYDAEFFYVGIEAHDAPGVAYAPAERPRPRDPDLSDQDRIELAIDLDRDFTTYYKLSVDHRGQPAEECWGDASWNPTWFVAAAAQEHQWMVEAAIPLDQLTGVYPGSRSVWAIGLQRIVPGAGLQSWNTPAAVAVVPEGFGYLIFE